MLVYTALPETTCRLIRAASDRLATVEIDDANNCLKIDGQPIERDAVVEYMIAWRKSGLWARNRSNSQPKEHHMNNRGRPAGRMR